jgi:hypothetical protein
MFCGLKQKLDIAVQMIDAGGGVSSTLMSFEYCLSPPRES